MSFYPSPGTNLKKNVKIDGFFVISKTWNIWNPIKCPCVIFPLLVSKQRVRSVAKGSRYFMDFRYVYAIRLFDVCDVLINLFFFSEEEDLEYSHLIGITTRCLGNALNFLNLSESYSRKRQKVNQFEEKAKDKCLICLKDYSDVGEIFSRELIQATYNTNLRFAFFSSATGQSQHLEYFDHNKIFIQNSESVIEVIYHVAIDSIQDSKYLLWSKKGLESILHKPSQQYYPNCLGTLGNFYYDANQIPLRESDLEITQIKFYTKLFSFCHDNPAPPFREPRASILFLRAASMGFRKKTKASIKKIEAECNNVRNELELLKRIVHDLSVQSTGVARLEAICSCNKLTSVTEAAQQCVRGINNSNLISSNTLHGISAETLKFRCESFFQPYINAVENHLNQLEKMLQPEPMLDFLNITLDEIMTVEAGEAVIAFMLYGRSVKTSVSPGHNYELCKELGLLSSHFESTNEVFPVLGKNYFHVEEHGRLVFNATFNYVPYLDRKGFNQSIGLSQLLSVTSSLSNSENMITLCRVIVQKICQCIIVSFGKYVRGVPTISKTSVLIGRLSNPVIISSHAFSHLFFSMTNSYFVNTPGLIWLRNLIKQYLTVEEIYDITLKLGKHLDTELCKKQSCLFFPVMSKTMLIISPFGDRRNIKQTVLMWNKALEHAMHNSQLINKLNLNKLAHGVIKLNLKNLENIELNGLLIEANSCVLLNFEMVKLYVQKYTLPILA